MAQPGQAARREVRQHLGQSLERVFRAEQRVKHGIAQQIEGESEYDVATIYRYLNE